MTTTVAGSIAPAGSRQRAALRTFLAFLARDFRVLRRDAAAFFVRTVTQPVLFVFVFAYVLPKVGARGGASPYSGAAHAHGMSFSTVLVPGMMASGVLFQGLLAVTTPLVMELSYTREIEDRVMAPLPIWALGLEKIVAGAIQALLAAVVVFPLVMVIHAENQKPDVDLSRWPLLLLVLLLATLLTASLGLLLGTVIDPRRLSTLFGVIIVPMMMLGCVYYPWAQLHGLRWLQLGVLINPLVYISEAMRMAITPDVPHMRTWVLMCVLCGGVVVVVGLALRTFGRRLVD